MTIQTILLLIVSSVGGIYDLKSRRIPNWLTFGAFFLALVLSIFQFRISEIANCLLGALVGISLLFVPYLMGGIGAGDVKLLGALGAVGGFKAVILIFLYSAVCGLFLGIVWIIFTPGHLKFLIITGQMLPQIDKKQKVPYGIAIMMGTFLYIMFGENEFFKVPIWL